MPKDKLIRVHLQLSEDDIERTDALFKGRLSRSEAVRLMMKGYLGAISAKAAAQNKRPSSDDLSLDDLHE